MTSLNELLGDQLLEHKIDDNDNDDQIINLIETNKLNGKTIGLYFSAHWCPPSRQFTIQLANIYKNISNDIKHKFDIVFISCDRDQQSFNNYYKIMPWKSIHFSDRIREQTLSNKYNIETIPSLIIISPSGQLLTSDGVKEIYINGENAIRQWSKEETIFPIQIDPYSQIDSDIDNKTQILINDDHDKTPLTNIKKKSTKKRTFKFYFILMAIICLIITIITLFTIFILFKFLPNTKKTILNIEKYKDIKFQAIFTTNYILFNENKSNYIENIEHISDQLNNKLNKNNKIKIINAFFLNNSISSKIICENKFLGNILQLDIIYLFSNQCQNENNICKLKLEEQLKNNIYLNIKFNNDYQFKNINIHLCYINQQETEQETKTTTMINLVNLTSRKSSIFKDSFCLLSPIKIIFIEIEGEQGTKIYDKIQLNIINNKQNFIVTFYEQTLNIIKIKINCNKQYINKDCLRSHHIIIWIDFNDDQIFQNQEKIIQNYSFNNNNNNNNISQDTYYLQIYIPKIDQIYIKNGKHKMKIKIIQSKLYKKICGKSSYSQIRQYIVNILSTNTNKDQILNTFLQINNSFCSFRPPKILFILLIGEQNTEIRDETPINNAITIYRNRQYLSVTLYETTLYILRIHLDSDQYNSINYHIHLSIDLNHDQIFQQIENRIHRSSLIQTKGLRGTYDFEISIPKIDNINTKIGLHRLRIILITNEYYQNKCGKTDTIETREYTANILTKPICQASPIILPIIPINSICSTSPGKIIFVSIIGEYGTQILDEISINNQINDYENRQDLKVKLFENKIYNLRIQIHCPQSQHINSFENNCNINHDINIFIDFNDQFKNIIHHKSLINNQIDQYEYNLQISIPEIDHINIKNGIHKMKIILIRSQNYQIQCQNNDYSQTREYTVDIITNNINKEIEYLYDPQIETEIETEIEPDFIVQLSADFSKLITHCLPDNLICSIDNDPIFSIKFEGEENTIIDDNIIECNLINNYQDKTNLIVKLFDNSIYKFSINLYCEHLLNNCNIIYYIYIWIDFNNDGIFDDNNEKFINNNQYNKHFYLNIIIPQIDKINYLNGFHRMRIILTKDDNNNIKSCYNNGYGQVRDYTIDILQK